MPHVREAAPRQPLVHLPCAAAVRRRHQARQGADFSAIAQIARKELVGEHRRTASGDPTEVRQAARAVTHRGRRDRARLGAPFDARRAPEPAEAAARRRFAAYLAALDQLVRAVDSDPR
jgi:hypothetical protein